MLISSLANPTIKALASLHTKKGREAQALFLVEGLQLVGFGVSAGWDLTTLLLKADYQPGARAEATLADALNTAAQVLEVTPEVMGKLSNKENPPSVMGVFKPRLQALKKLRPAAQDVWLVAEEPRDPGNLGTLIRSCDALGGSGLIILTPAADPFAPETVRATMGSIFHVPLVSTSGADFLAWHNSLKLSMAGLHLQGTEAAFLELGQQPKPLLLALGTEQSGLSAELTAACTTLVRIPMAGRAESLNLAQAGTLALWEARRAALQG